MGASHARRGTESSVYSLRTFRYLLQMERCDSQWTFLSAPPTSEQMAAGSWGHFPPCRGWHSIYCFWAAFPQGHRTYRLPHICANGINVATFDQSYCIHPDVIG